MPQTSFEEAVVYHCAPALVGLKSACLVCLSAAEYPDLPRMAEAYGRALGGRGIRFQVLCRCDRRFMLLVYRRDRLEAHLALPGCAVLLQEAGYPMGVPVEDQLALLARRLAVVGGFPHELGLFLGYPPEDVAGFLSGRTPCKLCGYWKVYHDEEGARRQFRRFDRCRAALRSRLQAGYTLTQLFGVPMAPAA